MDKNIKTNQNSEGAKKRFGFDANIPSEIRKDAEKEYKKQARKRKEAEKRFEELQARRKKLLEQKMKLQEKLSAEESIKLQEALKLKMLELEMKIKEVEESIKEDSINNADFLPRVEKAIQNTNSVVAEKQEVIDEQPAEDKEQYSSLAEAIKEVEEQSAEEEQQSVEDVVSEEASNNETEDKTEEIEPEVEEVKEESSEEPLAEEEVIEEKPLVEEVFLNKESEETNQEIPKLDSTNEPSEDVPEVEEEKFDEPENKEGQIDNQTKTQKVSLDEIQKAKEEMNKEKEEKEKASKKKKSPAFIDNLPPEESLADDLTDEELERYIQEEQAAQEKALLEEEQKSYEGMSEEEIKEAKSRKLKFLELQKRYNSRENVNPSDMGDYKKNLDFTINKNLKKFRVKPPKSLFKILVAVFTSVLVIGAIVAYIVVNKPPEPIVLTSMRLSQTKTYQTVGETLDLRGLYIYCEYSDGTQKTIKASENLISRTSNNINASRKITGFNNSKDTAFVYFALETQEVKLDITLTQFEVNSVSATLYLSKITAGDFISFDNLLLLAQTSDDRQLRIEPQTCSYKIAGTALTRTDEGIYVPQNIYGAQTLTIISYYNGSEYTSLINLFIEELIVEEPVDEPVEEPVQEQPITE